MKVSTPKHNQNKTYKNTTACTHSANKKEYASYTFVTISDHLTIAYVSLAVATYRGPMAKQ